MNGSPLTFVSPDGSLCERSTGGVRIVARRWTQPGQAEGDRYAWPTYHPGGSSLLCFSMWTDDEVTQGGVLSVDRAGFEMKEILPASDGRPIYACWSPRGERVATLHQDEGLHLRVVEPENPGSSRTILKGGPVFFAWSPDGSRLAVHEGKGEAAKLRIVDLGGRSKTLELGSRPGRFRAPQWSATGDLAFAAAVDGGSDVCVARQGGSAERLFSTPGAVALAWSPDGGTLAVGTTGDDRHSFGRLTTLSSGRRLDEVPIEDAVSFGWIGDTSALWVITVEKSEMCLVVWCATPDGRPPRRLCRFLPSESMLFWLSFFDQYSRSHPIVSPAGTALALSGQILDLEGQEPEPSTPSTFLVPLDGGPPEIVGDGSMAAWGPALAA